MQKINRIFLLLLPLIIFSACRNDISASDQSAKNIFSVSSSGINDGKIDPIYGAKGIQFVNGTVPSRSLPLKINGIPAGTRSLAVVMLDPDGKNWVHWLACNIQTNGIFLEIPENASLDLKNQMLQGKNDFGTIGYGGPTPPSGIHTYIIKVYALGDVLSLQSGFSLQNLEKAMKNKILAEAEIRGSYSH